MNLKFWGLILATVALALVILACNAEAQENASPKCAPHDVMVEGLAKQYEEHFVGRGINNMSHMIEVYAKEDGATWTIIVTAPPKGPKQPKTSCVVAWGEHWVRPDMKLDNKLSF